MIEAAGYIVRGLEAQFAWLNSAEMHPNQLNFCIHLLVQEAQVADDDDGNPDPRLYGRLGCIVQTSGSGKTALLRSLASFERLRYDLISVAPEALVRQAQGTVLTATLFVRKVEHRLAGQGTTVMV